MEGKDRKSVFEVLEAYKTNAFVADKGTDLSISFLCSFTFPHKVTHQSIERTALWVNCKLACK